ncbi:MAG TPA: sialidase family protein, partial [Pyrinomonadaceae bacterium]|nr:sialidase family protein [Pyrinomonadaceae bacterium]
VGPQGTVYVAWLEERKKAHPVAINKGQQKHKHVEENRDLFVAFSKNSGKTFSSKTPVASDVCPCCKTSLAVAPDGRVYVSWRQVLPGNLRHIAVASFADHELTVSTRVIVSDDRWVLAGCPVSGSSLSVSNDGALQVLWYADGQTGPTGVYRSESRDGGRSFSPRQLIAEGMTQGTPILLSQAGSAKAIWQRDQGTEAKVVTASIDSKGIVTGSSSEENNSQLPAAAMIGDQLVIVSIRQAANDRRSIWLIRRPAG